MAGSVDGLRGLWPRAALRLSLRVNLGIFLERVLPLWTGAALLFAALVLWERGRGGANVGLLWWGLSLVVAAIGLAQSLRGRASFYSGVDGLVLLEDRLGLKNRLSAARDGVGDWPPFPSRLPSIVRFSLVRTLGPVAFSLALLLVAGSVPVHPTEPSILPLSQPVSWQEMAQVLEELRDESIVEPEALDEIERRLDSLRQKPQEEWFQHASLEASDNLREELRSEVRKLARGLDEVDASLTGLGAVENDAPKERRRLLERRLSAAASDLDLGSLPLDRELSRELQTLARERSVRRATKEEIEKWRELRKRLYHGLPGRDEGEAVLVGRVASTGGAADSGDPGRGGVTRGPGTAPIDLSDVRTELGSTRVERALSEDETRGLLGESLGFSVGEHDVDTRSFRAGRDGGSVASTGQGGELVFRGSLTPSERRILQKYFK
jgi:hypothetical protein